jgi:HlyD family secretion protein
MRWTLGLGLTAAVVAWVLRPRPVELETGRVDRGPLSETLEDDGHAWARRRWKVSAPVAGFLAEPTLRPGDPVNAGDVVARLSALPVPLTGSEALVAVRARLEAARAAVARAQAGVAQSDAAAEALEVERRRVEILVRAGSAAQAQLDEIEGRVRVLGHEREAARSALHLASHEEETARAALRQAQPGEAPGAPLLLTTPLNGVVLAVPVEVAGPVQPGAPLVEVGALESLEIRVLLLSDDVATLRPGMRAEVREWGGAPLAAHVVRVEPRAVVKVSALGVEESRAQVVLALDDAPPPGLGDGFQVRVVVERWRGEGVRVPAGAWLRRGAEWGAWRVEGGRARWVGLGRGHAGANHVEALSGAREGDEVVLYPDERVEEGTRVRGRVVDVPP